MHAYACPQHQGAACWKMNGRCTVLSASVIKTWATLLSEGKAVLASPPISVKEVNDAIYPASSKSKKRNHGSSEDINTSPYMMPNFTFQLPPAAPHYPHQYMSASPYAPPPMMHDRGAAPSSPLMASMDFDLLRAFLDYLVAHGRMKRAESDETYVKMRDNGLDVDVMRDLTVKDYLEMGLVYGPAKRLVDGFPAWRKSHRNQE